jgi:hypothetical protein
MPERSSRIHSALAVFSFGDCRLPRAGAPVEFHSSPSSIPARLLHSVRVLCLLIASGFVHKGFHLTSSHLHVFLFSFHASGSRLECGSLGFRLRNSSSVGAARWPIFCLHARFIPVRHRLLTHSWFLLQDSSQSPLEITKEEFFYCSCCFSCTRPCS